MLKSNRMAKTFGKKLRVVMHTLFILDGRELSRVVGGVAGDTVDPGGPDWSHRPSCKGFCISNGRNQDCASKAGNCG